MSRRALFPAVVLPLVAGLAAVQTCNLNGSGPDEIVLKALP